MNGKLPVPEDQKWLTLFSNSYLCHEFVACAGGKRLHAPPPPPVFTKEKKKVDSRNPAHATGRHPKRLRPRPSHHRVYVLRREGGRLLKTVLGGYL